jgi:hypothetical protein
MEHIMANDKVKFLEVKSNGTVLAFVFGDKGRLEFDAAKCNERIREQAMYHGFNQKIRDSAAGYSKDKDYAGAREEMAAVIDSLYNGEWNRKGGGIGIGVVMEDLAYAIATIKNVTVERAMEAVKKLDEAKRKEYAKNTRVQALMAENKAQRLASAVKGDEELDIDLDDEDDEG